MKRILFTLFVCSLLNYSSAQNRTGYLGKKNLVSFFTTSNVMFFNLTTNYLVDGELPFSTSFKKDNTQKSRLQLFRVDYRISYQRILSDRFALGIEYANEKVRLNSESYGYHVFDIGNGVQFSDYSSPVFNANSFLITLEFFKRNKIAGQGFSFGCGIGPKLYSFNDKQNYRLDESTPIGEYGGLSPKLNYIAINAFYQMTYRHPLTNFLSFEIGLRFHTGFVLRKNYNNIQDSNNNFVLWDESSVYKSVRNQNATNFASLKAGFVFTL